MAKPRKTNRHRPAPRTAFKPGHPKYGGRKKGTPNRFSGELKQLVLNALANAHKDGSQSWLQIQANRNPRAFMAMLTKLLPTQVTGKEGGPIELLVEKAQGNLSKLSDAELEQLNRLLLKAGLVDG